jgi:hypothetical protein
MKPSLPGTRSYGDPGSTGCRYHGAQNRSPTLRGGLARRDRNHAGRSLLAVRDRRRQDSEGSIHTRWFRLSCRQISAAPEGASARRPLHQRCDSNPPEPIAGLVTRSHRDGGSSPGESRRPCKHRAASRLVKHVSVSSRRRTAAFLLRRVVGAPSRRRPSDNPIPAWVVTQLCHSGNRHPGHPTDDSFAIPAVAAQRPARSVVGARGSEFSEASGSLATLAERLDLRAKRACVHSCARLALPKA